MSKQNEIQRDEYVQRRALLISRMKKNSIAVIPAGTCCLRNADTEYPFRQDSNFYYLSGFNEPDAVLVLDADEQQSFLFTHEDDPLLARWVGARLGSQAAVEVLAVDAAFPRATLFEYLHKKLLGKEVLYSTSGVHSDFTQSLNDCLGHVRRAARHERDVPQSLSDITALIAEGRVVKSPSEQVLMREAACLSAQAHCRVMRYCSPGQWEYQLEAEFMHECRIQGAEDLAYPPIVASGAHACTLHYTENRGLLGESDLLLLDAGAECQNYAADITRTFPVKGRFSEPQRDLYQVVLSAQKAAIEILKPGVSWPQPQEVICRVLTEGLCDLGLLKGSVDELLEKEAYRPFYLHSHGHYLGLDVHDSGAHKHSDDSWRSLEAGMVLTVEPGLYIPADFDGVDAQWRGIGIRIEDDILITEQGSDVLSQDVPKEIAAIEALMAG